MDVDITSNRNFDNVFFKKNDSLYKEIWNHEFENSPEQAFLIACGYYYLTRDLRVKKDVDQSYSQLTTIYLNSK